MAERLDIHQQLANEYYRQHMLQSRLQDNYPEMVPMSPLLHHPHANYTHAMLQHPATHPATIGMLGGIHGALPHQPPPPPPRMITPGLPGVDAVLHNADMWQEFHGIGNEMIITKTGRRMFPSLRIAFNGLDDEVNYCVLIEMVPIAECRYKYSNAQWVPAGGAEPQSNCRIYVHPDSPALGSHWMTQPVLFNKIKLTNNTMDSHGHVVLASMHKYVPRIHIIRANDVSQFPYSAQQPFCFPETEFIAVTAYQNDRITRLKIDNNPFAKGFRESGQSRCKRKNPPGTSSPAHSRNSGARSDSEASDTECSTPREHHRKDSKRLRTNSDNATTNHATGNGSRNDTPLLSDDEEIDVGDEDATQKRSLAISSPNTSQSIVLDPMQGASMHQRNPQPSFSGYHIESIAHNQNLNGGINESVSVTQAAFMAMHAILYNNMTSGSHLMPSAMSSANMHFEPQHYHHHQQQPLQHVHADPNHQILPHDDGAPSPHFAASTTCSSAGIPSPRSSSHSEDCTSPSAESVVSADSSCSAATISLAATAADVAKAPKPIRPKYSFSISAILGED